MTFPLNKKIWSLVSCAIFLIACDSEPPSGDLGPVASPYEICLAQNESVNLLKPDAVKVGQLSHAVETQEVITSEGPFRALLSEWVTEVTKREEPDSYLELTTRKKVIDYTIEDKPQFEFENVFAFDGRPASCENKSMKLARAILEGDTIAKKPEQVTVEDISFHNLNKNDVVATLPQKVLDRPDCLGFKNCQVKATQLYYDIVFHFSDGTRKIHQIEWLVSSEVPFFSSVLKQCAKTVVAIGGAQVLVRQCQEVVDFNF